MSQSPRVITLRIRLPTNRTLIILGALFIALGAGLFLGNANWQQVFNPTKRIREGKQSNLQLADSILNKRVEKLLASLTLQEKIGQLCLYTGGLLTGPEGEKVDCEQMITHGQVGALFNVVGVESTNYYQHLAVEKSPDHIPLLFGYDVIHGHRTIFPVPLALASSFDPELIRQTAQLAADEASRDGVRWVYSPMVDIARDARWGRITEGAGEDPYLGSELARAYVEGYQGNDLSRSGAVAACVKHFAAYGAANAGREYNSVDMSELTLRQFYLPPYHEAVEAGSATVMSAFNPLNGVPATANPFTLTKILRKEWNFNGFVVSDFGAVGELIKHGVANNGQVAARKALVAGVDMDMQSDLYRTRLESLVNNQFIPISTLDESVRRILRVKFALGLFDHPFASPKKSTDSITPDKRDLARKAAEETLVLLKNNVSPPDTNPVLPLNKDPGTIAVIGPLADSQIDMLGSWPAMGNPLDVITLRTALQRRFSGHKTKILYEQGTDILTDSTRGFSEAEAVAKQADVVLLALGESGATMTGESTSLTRLDLPGNQEQLLESIVHVGKPTVLILFDGRPLALKWAAANVPAILEAWYPGIEAGPAVVNILFGDVNPSAKLPVTFPRAVGQEPLYYNQLPTGRPAENIDLTHPPTGEDKYYSRYIDETNAPLYPFGFGLSYTQFVYSKLRLSEPRISVARLLRSQRVGESAIVSPLQISVDLKNSGAVPGVEIVQLYLRNTGGTVEEPVRELKGFQRVALDPGQSQKVIFDLDYATLSDISLEMKPIVEPGEYQIWIGGSSGATQNVPLEVTP